MDEENFPPLPPGLRALFGMDQDPTFQKIEEHNKKWGESIENEILMPLWAHLGDHTETYWQAMQLSKKMVECVTDIRNHLRETTSAHHVLLLKTLSNLFAREASVIEEAQAIADEAKRKADQS